MKKDPILFVPNIDWSDPKDVDRLFERSIFCEFDNDPLMIGRKLNGLDDRIGMFHERNMPQATLRHNLGQLPATRFNKLSQERGEELVDPTLAILMRVFDKYPNLCPPFPYVDIEVLMEKCGIESKRELSLLLGRDQVSATRYTSTSSDLKKSPSPTTMMLTFIIYLFNEAGRLDEYRELVHTEAKYRGTDNLVTTGFPKVKPPGCDLVRLLKSKCAKILKKPGATEEEKEEAQEVINKCISYMGFYHEIRLTRQEIVDFEVDYAALKSRDAERAEEIKEDIEHMSKKLASAREEERLLMEELKVYAEKL